MSARVNFPHPNTAAGVAQFIAFESQPDNWVKLTIGHKHPVFTDQEYGTVFVPRAQIPELMKALQNAAGVERVR